MASAPGRPGSSRSHRARPAQTLDQILDQMTRYNVLPKLINVTAEAGAPPIMPPEYVHREIVKGQLPPVGRFRGPLAARTNYSTLHLYGPGLDALAGWQVLPGVRDQGLGAACAGCCGSRVRGLLWPCWSCAASTEPGGAPRRKAASRQVGACSGCAGACTITSAAATVQTWQQNRATG